MQDCDYENEIIHNGILIPTPVFQNGNADDIEAEKPTSPKKLYQQDRRRQILASLRILSLVLHAGCNMSYSTVMAPQLRENNLIDEVQASWIASVVNLGTMAGCLSCGWFMDRWGRLKMARATCLLVAFAWLLLSFTPDPPSGMPLILVARILAGFGGGLSTCCVIYVSEVTHPQRRASLLCFNSVFVSLGIFLVCVLGLWCDWRVIAAVLMVCSLLTLALMVGLPESGRWLAHFRSGENVGSSIGYFHSFPKDFEEQLASAYAAAGPGDNTNVALEKGVLSKLKNFVTDPSVVRPILALGGLFLTQQLAGTYLVIFYAAELFIAVGGEERGVLSPGRALFILGLVRLGSSLVVPFLAHRMRVTSLLLLSGFGMAIAMGCACWSAAQSQPDFAAIAILCHVAAAAIGFLPLPWVFIGHGVRTEAKAQASSISLCFAYLLMFGTVKVFPLFKQTVGLIPTLVTLGSFSILSLGYVQCFAKRFNK